MCFFCVRESVCVCEEGEGEGERGCVCNTYALKHPLPGTIMTLCCTGESVHTFVSVVCVCVYCVCVCVCVCV